MTAAVMQRHHFDVFVAPPAVGLLVFDAEIREVNLVVVVRQVMFVRPLGDLVSVSIRMSVVVAIEGPLRTIDGQLDSAHPNHS